MVVSQSMSVNPTSRDLSQPFVTQPLRQMHPQRRNHFSIEDHFHFDRDQGTIHDWYQTRSILVTEDFVVGMINGLEQEVGPASTLVMYKIGEEWGLKDAGYFQRNFQKEYERELRQTNLSFLFEAWWWPFVTQGWGNWDIDLSEQKNGFMFINIFDSVVARTLGDVGKPVCYLYAGMFAGFFTGLIKKPLGCIEIQCYAMGETYCKFLVGKQERIDAASFWQNEGASASDIEKRMKNGQFAP